MNAALKTEPECLPEFAYAVCPEWEHNGYHDSDFYVVVFTPSTGELRREETGTTRFAGGFRSFPKLPAQFDAAFLTALEDLWFRRLVARDTHRVEHPKLEDVRQGTKVFLTQEVRNRPRAEVEVACRRCGGLGCWVNPRNDADRRECFGCRGTGKQKGSKAGKGKALVYPSGTTAEVVRAFENRSRYGTWDRGSVLVLRTSDGTEFRCPLDAVRLGREVDAGHLRKCAREAAAARNVYSLFATSAVSLV